MSGASVVPLQAPRAQVWRLEADEGLEVVLVRARCYHLAFRRAASSPERIQRVKAQTAVTSRGQTRYFPPLDNLFQSRLSVL